MTREEEIKREADKYTDNVSNYAKWSDDGGWSETNDIKLIEKAFIEGAKWADKTMIDKACEWLEEQNKMCMCELEMILGSKFINDFKKAMEK